MQSSFGQIGWNNYQIQEVKGRYKESTDWKPEKTLKISKWVLPNSLFDQANCH